MLSGDSVHEALDFDDHARCGLRAEGLSDRRFGHPTTCDKRAVEVS